jgi:hypothetical protein
MTRLYLTQQPITVVKNREARRGNRKAKKLPIKVEVGLVFQEMGTQMTVLKI